MQYSRAFYTGSKTPLLSFSDGSQIFWDVGERDGFKTISYMIFYGKSQKPKANYYIKNKTFDNTLEEFVQVIQRFAARIERVLNEKTKQKLERKAETGAKRLEIGSILHGQWGYEQTNNEFWQVTGMSASRKTCTIKRLKVDHRQTGSMQGFDFPLPGEFTGKEETNKLIVRDSISCKHCTLNLWDGLEKHSSSYA